MAAGFIAQNPAGVQTFRMDRFYNDHIGTVAVGTTNGSAALAIPAGAAPWFVAVPNASLDWSSSNKATGPVFTLSGNLLSWSWDWLATAPDAPTRVAHTIYYGLSNV